jgi:steroid 5-alpha reductase family enzyme
MSFFAFDPYNLICTALVTIVIQAACFAFAAIFKTDKLTDISYSLTFVLLVWLTAWAAGADSPRAWLVAGLVTLWGLRLGAYLFYRILNIGRDERFDGVREKFSAFLKFWIFQALVVWIVLSPATILLSLPDDAPLGWVDFAALALWAAGFLIEAFADHQKFVFRNNPANRGRWIQSGLWKYSRHPNYFGETLLWWAIFLFAVPFLSGWLWLSVLGPICVTAILLFFSGIPPLEKKADEKFGTLPEYQEYKRRTSIFALWPPRAG